MSLRLYQMVYEAKDMVGLLTKRRGKDDLSSLLSSITLKLELIRKHIDEIDETDKDARWET